MHPPISPSKDLILPVKKKWFNQIKSGLKTEEYRLDKEYWRKRFVGKTYARVIVTLGYPSKDDHKKRLIFPWAGYKFKEVKCDEWEGEQRVFAIPLVVSWTVKDFQEGRVRIDFRDYAIPELYHLRKILKLVRPDFDEPAYCFGACYYCKGNRWYEGGKHQLIGDICRAEQIEA